MNTNYTNIKIGLIAITIAAILTGSAIVTFAVETTDDPVTDSEIDRSSSGSTVQPASYGPAHDETESAFSNPDSTGISPSVESGQPASYGPAHDETESAYYNPDSTGISPSVDKFLGLRPDCDPTKAPSEPGACDINAFIVWVQRIIKWLFYISMPLALIFGMYGGFVIITAGGSEERVKHGRDVLKAAVIGLLIIFLSNLLVTTIINVLTKGKL